LSGERTDTARPVGGKDESSFLEMLSIFLRQDYHFPLLEIFAFLFVVGILLTSSLPPGYDETYIASSYFGSGAVSLPILVFMILVWKNISFGLGGDLEKGVMQTFLTYPLKRLRILGARLLSSVGVALVVLTLAELVVLLATMPAFAIQQASTLTLNYLAALALPILITAVVLVVCVFAKTSGLPLVVGLAFYFAAGLFLQFFVGYGVQTENSVLLGATYLLNPAIAFQEYYSHFSCGPPSQGFICGATWGTPGLEAAAAYLVGSYFISIALLSISALWFTRRLEV